MTTISSLIGGGSAIKSQQTLSISPSSESGGTTTHTVSTVSDMDKCLITATVFPTGPSTTSHIYGATVSGFRWVATTRMDSTNQSAHWQITSTSQLTYRANGYYMNGAYITITEYE